MPALSRKIDDVQLQQPAHVTGVAEESQHEASVLHADTNGASSSTAARQRKRGEASARAAITTKLPK